MLHPPRDRRSGFSIVESLAVLTIVGILMSFAIPGITKNAERVRLDKAASGLRSLWRAERRYRLEHGAFTTSLPALENGGYVRDTFRLASAPFTYEVAVGSRSDLLIEAKRADSDHWSGSIRIDELGKITGKIMSQDGETLAP